MTKLENIPAYLREHGLFCLWKYEERDGRKTKMPYNPHSPQERARSNDPGTFAPLDDAAARAGDFDGLGIGIFDGIAGIDIDHCIQGGQLSSMAADIVEIMDAYTEISPSGEGLRILFLAPGFSYDTAKYYVKNSPQGLELYIPGMTQRYLTVTGNTIRARDIVNRADRLQTILEKYMKRPQTAQAAAPLPSTPANIPDADLINRAKNAKNGGLFSALWEGSWERFFGSQSEADISLCNLLAFWTGRDAARMDSLFRQSGLFRDKWDRKQSGTTYGAITIQNAIDHCQEVYTPPKERPQAPQTAPAPVDYETPPEVPQQPPKTPVQLFDDFMAKIQTDAYKPLKTGLPAFDKLLGGGIMRQSLVILSAAPGTGKTTLTQQIFELMAGTGTDVIFLNLEMSREQLLARSLSRQAFLNGHKDISATDILKGYAWDETQRGFIQEAADEYRKHVAPRMQYNPENCWADLDSILNSLNAAGEAARQENKPAPVVVVDYLHLITSEKREEAGELLKRAVQGFKDYAKGYDTFVFAISANNRTANSSGIVSLESGRDTSALEYSADILLGLNYAALAEKRNKPDSAKPYDAGNPEDMAILQKGDANGNREMIVQVLKSRMDKAGGKLRLAFNPGGSVFLPIVDKPGRYAGYREESEIPMI